MNEYLILPECDDTNRGDQALIWETVSLAESAGFVGKYYMLASAKACDQSEKIGIGHIQPILVHPSCHFKQNNNLHYTKRLKLKWGLAALKDVLVAIPLLSPSLRKLIMPFYSNDVKETLNHYAKASVSFVKGGGFLHANGGLTETYKIFFFLYHINLSLSYGHDVYVMPNSFGPFNAPCVKHMICKTLSKCKVVMTRESVSNLAVRQELNLCALNEADLAFHLQKENLKGIKEKLRDQNIPFVEKKCVAITVRPYRFPGEADGENLFSKYMAGIGEFAQWLWEHDYFPVFIEHVSSKLPHEDDMKAIEKVISVLPKNGKWSVFSDVSLNCREMKSVYSCFNYTVGTRFHSVIFSLSERVPSIAITYGGNKGLGIMKDLGMEQYAIDMKCVTGELLINKFEELVHNEDEIVQQLDDLQTRLNENRKKVCEMLRK